jgi:hypothetical protein
MSEMIFVSRSGDFATARRGLDSYEVDFIRNRSKSGVSASNIARMLNRPESDIKPYCYVPPVRKAPEVIPIIETNDPYVPKLAQRSRRQRALPLTDRAKAIVRSVAGLYGLSINDIVGGSPGRHHSMARDQACWRLKAIGYGYSQIGRFLSGRDHSTIIKAVERHDRRIAAQARGDDE